MCTVIYSRSSLNLINPVNELVDHLSQKSFNTQYSTIQYNIEEGMYAFKDHFKVKALASKAVLSV